MVEKSGAARRSAVEHPRPDALAYWYLQESLPLDPDDAAPSAAETPAEEARLPAGWWLVPAVLLSLPAWLVIGAALF